MEDQQNGRQLYIRKKEDNIPTEKATIAINENCRCKKRRVKCKGSQKQHADTNNANGKQPTIIENNMEKPQQ